ncbi:MAG: DUF969 domain-containing protein [Clostridium sp.]
MKLIGILIVILGFSLKLDTIAVVLVSGLATGLVSGISFSEILNILGKSFVDTRYMTIFLLTLPIIGICERYGLKERAVELIRSAGKVTAGKVCTLYLLIRQLSAAFSVKLGGHPQFIRPLINPMAQGAAITVHGEIDEEDEELIKGYAATSDNYGNFFGQDLFMASSGVLLIVGTLGEQGFDVTQVSVAKASIPIAVIAFVIAFIQYKAFDKKLDKKYSKKN